jgi:hypothetical protein
MSIFIITDAIFMCLYIYMCVCVCVCVKFDYLVKVTDSYVTIHKVQTLLMIFSIFVEHKVNRVARSTFGPRELK